MWVFLEDELHWGSVDWPVNNPSMNLLLFQKYENQEKLRHSNRLFKYLVKCEGGGEGGEGRFLLNTLRIILN